MESKSPVLKGIIKFLGSAGVSVVASNVIRATISPDANLIVRTMTVIGELVITTIVSSKSAEYIEAELKKIGL